MGIDLMVSGGIAIAGAIGVGTVSLLARQAQSEFKDWTPRATNRLINQAVQRLPEEKRERFREEWAAHLNDTPGQIWKWRIAIGYVIAARRMVTPPTPDKSRPRKRKPLNELTGMMQECDRLANEIKNHLNKTDAKDGDQKIIISGVTARFSLGEATIVIGTNTAGMSAALGHHSLKGGPSERMTDGPT